MERGTTDAPKRRLKGPQRRALIERAATELFAQRGYDGVSIEEIAEAAGVSRTVIYDHYSSKEELHRALSEEHGRRLIEFMAERASGGSHPLERLRTGVDAVLEFIENDPYTWRIIFSEQSASPERAEHSLEMQHQASAAIVALISSNPVAAPLIAERGTESVERLAEFLRSGIAGIARWWFDHPGTPREEIRDEVVELLWLGMERIIGGVKLPPQDG